MIHIIFQLKYLLVLSFNVDVWNLIDIIKSDFYFFLWNWLRILKEIIQWFGLRLLLTFFWVSLILLFEYSHGLSHNILQLVDLPLHFFDFLSGILILLLQKFILWLHFIKFNTILRSQHFIQFPLQLRIFILLVTNFIATAGQFGAPGIWSLIIGIAIRLLPPFIPLTTLLLSQIIYELVIFEAFPLHFEYFLFELCVLLFVQLTIFLLQTKLIRKFMINIIRLQLLKQFHFLFRNIWKLLHHFLLLA